MQDRELFDLFLAHNMQAIVQAQSRYGAYCRMIAQGILRDAQQIDACIGETWSLAWELVPEQKPEHLKLFIGNLTRKLCLARLETTPESATDEFAFVQGEIRTLASAEADLSAKISEEKFSHVLGTFLAGLSERDLGIFVRRYYYFESAESIALKYHLETANVTNVLCQISLGLQQALGRKVCLPELSALLLIGEIDPALIEKSETYKPARRSPSRKKYRRKPKKWLIGLITAVALIVALLPLLLVSVWQLDAYVQYEYPAYSGTVPSALDYLLTQDTNLVSSLLSEQNREALHQRLAGMADRSKGAQIVLHGSEGLKFQALGNGFCVVKSGKSCVDSHVLIPSVSPDGDLVVGIENEAFSQNPYVTEITVPSPVLMIGAYAFRDCNELTKVHLAPGVIEIGAYAFEDCSSLTSLHLPLSVIKVGQGITSGCKSLESITTDFFCLFFYAEGNCLVDSMSGALLAGCQQSVIPEGVKSIAANAFAYTDRLTEIHIPEGVTSIGEHAFENCDDLVNVTFPQSLSNIEKAAFMGCRSLESVRLPQSMNYIGESAFEDCDALVELMLPEDVWKVDGRAFADCDGLTEVVIPRAWNYIPSDMCRECDSLKSVQIQGNMQYIGKSAFASCSRLEHLTFLGSVQTIYETAFYECSLTKLHLPEGLETISDRAFACNDLMQVTLPESLYSIEYGAFMSNDTLQEIRIPAGVTYMENEAFAGCGILRVEVDEQSERYRSEGNCIIERSNQPKLIFGNQYSTIPEEVEVIGVGAFRYCTELKEVNIPGGVTRIEAYAFDGCANLRNVYYPRAESDWSRIEWDPNTNVGLKKANMHFSYQKDAES